MKQRINALFFYIGLVYCSHVCHAQDHILSLWEGEIPNAKESPLQETRYITNSLRIGKVINPQIEVFLPSKQNATGKAVLICPGGGYSVLAYDKEGTDIAKWLNGYGIAGIVLKYRLPEDSSNILPHLSPLLDAKRGIEMVRANAREWGIDSSKIGVMGFSAGGHLASTLGTHFDKSNRPAFIALIYPVITMKNDFTHNGSRTKLLGLNPTDELVEYYSNELQVKSDTPPTFIVHAEDDGVVPVENSLKFFMALKEKKTNVEMHIYPVGGHGFSMALNRGKVGEWSGLFINWLKER